MIENDLFNATEIIGKLENELSLNRKKAKSVFTRFIHFVVNKKLLNDKITCLQNEIAAKKQYLELTSNEISRYEDNKPKKQDKN